MSGLRLLTNSRLPMTVTPDLLLLFGDPLPYAVPLSPLLLDTPFSSKSSLSSLKKIARPPSCRSIKQGPICSPGIEFKAHGYARCTHIKDQQLWPQGFCNNTAQIAIAIFYMSDRFPHRKQSGMCCSKCTIWIACARLQAASCDAKFWLQYMIPQRLLRQ